MSRVSSRMICLILALVAAAPAIARDWQDGVEGSIGSGALQMYYRYYLPPNYDETQAYPLVLSLHGAGQFGQDNSSQVAFNIGPLLNKTEVENPAILLAPQLPIGTGWSPNNPIDRTDEILQRIIDDFSVDTNRLYITGLSMGGFGTMEYLHSFNVDRPNGLRFAAGVPLSGAFAEAQSAEALREIPIWLAHGSADTVVSPDSSRNTFRIIAGLGSGAPIPFGDELLGGPTAIDGNVRYTELIGRGHDIWSRTYAKNELYEWMFAQSLVPEPSSALLAIVCMFAATRLWQR